MAYYNTNNETGEELQASRRKSSKQKTEVLAVFLTYPTTPLSPDDIHSFIKDNSEEPDAQLWPITSIRRAISDLTKEGELFKTEEKKMGSYGKRVHCWIVQCPHEKTTFKTIIQEDGWDIIELEEEICINCDQTVHTVLIP
jgi:Fe2+ or Zn2+ uptake regulation protein